MRKPGRITLYLSKEHVDMVSKVENMLSKNESMSRLIFNCVEYTLRDLTNHMHPEDIISELLVRNNMQNLTNGGRWWKK